MPSDLPAFPRPANVVSLPTRPAASKTTPSGVSGALAALAKKTLGPTLEATFKATDDDLFKRSEQNQELFDGLRELRRRQPLIVRRFEEALEKGFLNPGRPANESTDKVDIPLGELSLVGENELEENLAVARMVASAEQVHAAELHALRERFAVLAGGQDPDRITLPLAPQALADAFQASLEDLDGLSVALRIVLYKHFEHEAMASLGPLLALANQKLIEAGVLPNLRPQAVVRNTPSYPAASGGAAESTAPAVQGSPEGAVLAPPAQAFSGGTLPAGPGVMMSPQDAAAWGELRALLASRRDGGTPAVPPSSLGASGLNAPVALQPGAMVTPLVPASVQEINEALLAVRELGSMLQSMSQAGTSQPALPPTELKEKLIEQLREKGDDRKGLGVHEDTIDAVGLLFEHVLKDPNLPGPMQVLLSRLQLPFIKVAVVEPALFAQPQHPARQLLDVLGETGKGWSAEGDRGGVMLAKIESVVDGVTHGFLEDPQIFAHQLEQFKAFLVDASRRQEVAEKRSEELAQTKDRLEQAQNAASRAIAERMAGKALPDWARALLVKDWASVMTLVARKDGEDSPAFRKALFFVDKVVGAPDVEGEAGRKTLAMVLPSLTRQMQEGLATVGVPSKAIEDTVLLLKDYLERFAGLSAKPPVRPPTPVVPAPAPEPPKPQPEARWLKRVKDLGVGDWVEFQDDKGGTTRGKVAWVSSFTGKVLFVALNGTRLGERLPEDLAWMMQRGQAKVIENKPLFDRAMGAVLEKLKR